ncbi:MAG: MipA/OmpV family protein [Methylococcales bacterium]
MKTSNYLKLSLLALLSIFSSAVMAADIARDIRIGETTPYSSDNNFFEIGGGVGLLAEPVKGEDDGFGIKIFIAGRYQWHGIFIESIDASSMDLIVGYNAWNTQRWSLDLIGTSLNNEVISDDNDELKGLNDRDGDFLLGARATGYYGNYIIQLQLLDGVSNVHDGVVTSIEAGRSWQVRNWNYHAILGWRHHQKQVVNYYLGVSQEEAQATSLPEYQAGAGSLLTAEIGATYPISEHWVFRGTASLLHLTSNLSKSPIIRDKNSGSLYTTLSYVF